MGKLYLGTQAVTPILNRGGGGGNEPGGNIKITAYDTTTGVISGGGFGSTPGYVYVLDRDTNTYVPQTVSSWTPSSITLDTPVDLTTLEGTTSMAVVADDGTWSNKWLLTGDVAVSGWGKLYVQNPDTRAIYTVAVTSQADFEQLYSSTLYRSITIGNDTFWNDEIVGFQFGSDFNLTTLGDYFLGYCLNLMQPVIPPASINTMGGYFLYGCRVFNQPIDGSLIGNNFLAACKSFNQPIIIPNIAVMPDSFLSGCSSFNQPVVIPSSVQWIGERFLNQCSVYNQPVTIPSGVTSVGDYFMYGCSCFNQSISLPSSLLSIGAAFLSGCNAFNQPLVIPERVTYINHSFMLSCSMFNHPLTVPSSVTTIITGGSNKQGFMGGCNSFSSLTVDTTAHPTDIYSLATASSSTAKMYVKGITVKGTGRSSWLSALPNRTSSPFRKLIDGGE